MGVSAGFMAGVLTPERGGELSEEEVAEVAMGAAAG